jgi:hypothetical protein
LHGKSRCSSSIPNLHGCDYIPSLLPRLPAVPLPQRLYIHQENSANDNKIRFFMAFYSLLIAKRVFKEVTMGFLIVEHSHVDINAYFSYLSKLLKQKNIYVLVALMKGFIYSQ